MELTFIFFHVPVTMAVYNTGKRCIFRESRGHVMTTLQSMASLVCKLQSSGTDSMGRLESILEAGKVIIEQE